MEGILEAKDENNNGKAEIFYFHEYILNTFTSGYTFYGGIDGGES